MKRPLTSEEMHHAVAYVDGSLDEQARAQFELSMAADAQLANAVEELLQTDEWMRREIARTGAVTGHVHRMRPWVWAASIAAAAAIVFGIGRAFLFERPARAEFTVALAESSATPEEFAARHDELRGLRPPGLDALRGPGEVPNITAEEFAARAKSVEDQVLRAVAAPAPPVAAITAGYFVVPLEVREPCSVIVLAVPEQGASQRMFPAASDADAIARARLAPGTRVLPNERFALEADAGGATSLHFQPGFLVPLGSRSLTVLCAARTADLDAATLQAIDAALARGVTVERLETLLAEHGFRAQKLRVIEPRD
jgi:hypothetical protein